MEIATQGDIETICAGNEEMINTIVDELRNYVDNKKPDFILSAIQMLTTCGETITNSEEVIHVLFTILIDLQHSYAHNAALDAILAIGGVDGLGILVREVLSNRQGGLDLYTGGSTRPSSEYRKWQRHLLTALANHPSVICHAIVPEIIATIGNPGAPEHIKRGIFMALPLLGDGVAARHVEAIAICLESLPSLRKEVMVALRSQGDIAERILISLAVDPSNPPVQKLAVLGLGTPPLGLSPHARAVNIALQSTAIPGPSIVTGFAPPPDDGPPTLTLDENVFLSSLKSALDTGALPRTLYTPPAAPQDHAVPPAVSLSVIDCLHWLLTQKSVTTDVALALCAACGAIGLPEGAKFVDPIESMIARPGPPPSPAVRAAVATTLTSFGPLVSNKGIKALIGLLSDNTWRVRHSAALALGAVGERADAAVPVLVKLLTAHRSNRADIAKCLATMGERGEACLLRLLTHPRQDLRAAAAHGLSDVNPYRPTLERIAKELAAALGRDDQPAVRCAILEALSTLSARCFEQVIFLQSQTLVEVLRRHLNDRAPTVRSYAAHLLSESGVIGQSALRQVLNTSRSTLVKIAAIGGLAESGVRSLYTLLLVFQTNQDQAVQTAIVSALQGFGGRQIGRHIVQLDPVSREKTIEALRHIQTSPYPSVSEQPFQTTVGEAFKVLEAGGFV